MGVEGGVARRTTALFGAAVDAHDLGAGLEGRPTAAVDAGETLLARALVLFEPSARLGRLSLSLEALRAGAVWRAVFVWLSVVEEQGLIVGTLFHLVPFDAVHARHGLRCSRGGRRRRRWRPIPAHLLYDFIFVLFAIFFLEGLLVMQPVPAVVGRLPPFSG